MEREAKEPSDIKRSIFAFKVTAHHLHNTTKYFARAVPLVQWFTWQWDSET